MMKGEGEGGDNTTQVNEMQLRSAGYYSFKSSKRVSKRAIDYGSAFILTGFLTCKFSKVRFPPHKGRTLYTINKIEDYSSSKSRKLQRRGLNPRKVGWVKKGAQKRTY